MSNKGTDFAEAIAAVFIGVVGGITLAAILEALSSNKYRCPSCNSQVEKGSPMCPYCNSFLRWD